MKRFNLYVAALSLVIDALAIIVGLVLAYQIHARGGELYAWPFYTYLKLIAAMLPIWLVLLASQRIYSVRLLARGWNVVPRLIIGFSRLGSHDHYLLLLAEHGLGKLSPASDCIWHCFNSIICFSR